jgi:hypothetical protein
VCFELLAADRHTGMLASRLRSARRHRVSAWRLP